MLVHSGQNVRRRCRAFFQVYVSQHLACPFGAAASVHAWERAGAAIAHLAAYFLHIAILRYVDDYFAPERFAGFLVSVIRICGY